MKELKQYAESKLTRRKFLTVSAAIGASTVAIAITPNVVAAATNTEVKVVKKEEGYQLTQHIVDYYKSAAL